LGYVNVEYQSQINRTIATDLELSAAIVRPHALSLSKRCVLLQDVDAALHAATWRRTTNIHRLL
jgi:hypothetical protein